MIYKTSEFDKHVHLRTITVFSVHYLSLVVFLLSCSEDWVCLLCQDVNETVVYGSEEMRTSSLSLQDQRVRHHQSEWIYTHSYTSNNFKKEFLEKDCTLA